VTPGFLYNNVLGDAIHVTWQDPFDPPADVRAFYCTGLPAPPVYPLHQWEGPVDLTQQWPSGKPAFYPAVEAYGLPPICWTLS